MPKMERRKKFGRKVSNNRLTLSRRMNDQARVNWFNMAQDNRTENCCYLKTNKFNLSVCMESLNKNEPSHLLMYLYVNMENIRHSLKNDLTDNLVVSLVQIFSRIFQFEQHGPCFDQIVLFATNKLFLNVVYTFVMKLPLQNAEQPRNICTDSFWQDLGRFFGIIKFGKAHELFKLLEGIIFTITIIEKSSEERIATSVKKNYNELMNKMTSEEEDTEMTPNDFRKIIIYPQQFELHRDFNPFLRKNIIKGSYEDVEHYLDVQFRLLREDFVAPLRQGLTDYFNPQTTKLSNIRLYDNTRCVGKHMVRNQLGFVVQLQYKKRNSNKQFMFGALVCFSYDNFNSLIFGKIIDRNLPRRLIAVSIEDGSLEVNVDYKMLECAVFFEPYFQVLTALQRINEQTFPFKKYLIDTVTTVEACGYIIDQMEIQRQIKNFNRSQAAAYKFALTSKLSIIQGPPGTGKTYIGLKIVEYLLKTTRKRVLVICYTNHALDQFLEGILEMESEVLRFGSQSKSEKLKYCTPGTLLKNKSGDEKYQYACMTEPFRTVKHNLEACSTVLHIIQSFKGVLKFSKFTHIIDEFEESWFHTAPEEDIIHWLLEEANLNLNVQSLEDSMEYVLMEFRNIMLEDNNKVKLIEDSKLLPLLSSSLELISLDNVKRNILKCTKEIDKGNLEFYMRKHKLQVYYKYFQKKMNEIRDFTFVSRPTAINLNQPYNMCFDDRWKLYRLWLFEFEVIQLDKLEKQHQIYKSNLQSYTHIKEAEDLKLMKQKRVIGMTTTGAAKMKNVLEKLQCPIVIVEEAAEVLESHTIAAVSSGCQHLILIGDHKQLRPNTADYNLNKNYNLGISLFERMVNNDMPHVTLNVQHRMRPEISSLIAPIIYPDLKNHKSVAHFPDIVGVDKNVYFITHTHLETNTGDSSKQNVFEAEYLIRLAKYLVLNGLDPSRITILSAYSAQQHLMQMEQTEINIIRDVLITSVDNYQGEENHVILLSLVRNNENGTIGFLELENRICVALSRAKHGLYIIGNMDQLSARRKTIWPQIRNVLNKANSLGVALPLRCRNHTKQVMLVKTIKDFDNVFKEGCGLMCNTAIKCGHICQYRCHLEAHEIMNCREPCKRILCNYEHKCPLKCYEECRKCIVPKEVLLACGHLLSVPCYITENDFDNPDYCCLHLCSTTNCTN